MFDFWPFLDKWGYAAVLIGAFLNNEPIMIAMSFLSFSKNLFCVYDCVVIAFIGSFASSVICFVVGKGCAKYFLRNLYISQNFQIIQQKLDSYGYKFILFFKFIYGLKLISPLLLGISTLSLKEFVIFNVLASAMWVFYSFLIGYCLSLYLEEVSVQIVGYIYVINIVLPIVLFFIYKMVIKLKNYIKGD